jgi:hypothetical protein
MEIYKEGIKKAGWSAMHFGPAHVVWEDENFEHAESCLRDFDKYAKNLTKEEQAGVRWSLEELSKVSLESRCPEPKEYDGEHPELYPPAKNIKMVK